MQIQQFVRDKINRTEPGKLITYQNFAQLYDEYPDSIAKALERLVKKGVLVRQKRGVFYKPEQGRFGALRVRESEIVRQFMYANGRLVGYPSGPEAFRALGISTQVPNTITIATTKARRRTSLNNVSIRFIQSKVKTIRGKDIPKLQLLDILRLIKKSQDVSPDQVISKATDILKDYSEKEQKDIVRLAKKYNPQTKALLGAILQNIGQEKLAEPLKNELNPLTSYNVGLSSDILPNKDQWAIV